jgi:hypothetical protein
MQADTCTAGNGQYSDVRRDKCERLKSRKLSPRHWSVKGHLQDKDPVPQSLANYRDGSIVTVQNPVRERQVPVQTGHAATYAQCLIRCTFRTSASTPDVTQANNNRWIYHSGLFLCGYLIGNKYIPILDKTYRIYSGPWPLIHRVREW